MFSFKMTEEHLPRSGSDLLLCYLMLPLTSLSLLKHENENSIIITILDIIHRPVFRLETRRFGDWILSPFSYGTYSDGPNRKR
jgi:hypothetical protein